MENAKFTTKEEKKAAKKEENNLKWSYIAQLTKEYNELNTRVKQLEKIGLGDWADAKEKAKKSP